MQVSALAKINEFNECGGPRQELAAHNNSLKARRRTGAALAQTLERSMEMNQPPMRFSELCEKIGLALMLSQKVQFALAHYFALYQIEHSQWSIKQAKESIEYHLSRAMGVLVSSIEKDAYPEESLFLKIKAFKEMRNWLAHDFDQEATPHLSQGNLFPEYIEKMENIINKASDLMHALDDLGQALAL